MPTTALVRIFTLVTIALAIVPVRGQVDTTQTTIPTGVVSGPVSYTHLTLPTKRIV